MAARGDNWDVPDEVKGGRWVRIRGGGGCGEELSVEKWVWRKVERVAEGGGTHKPLTRQEEDIGFVGGLEREGEARCGSNLRGLNSKLTRFLIENLRGKFIWNWIGLMMDSRGGGSKEGVMFSGDHLI